MPAVRFVIRNYVRTGLNLSFEVAAVDASGAVDTAYAGALTFSGVGTTVPGLPASYTFAPTDLGVRTFSTTIQTIENVQIFATDATATLANAGIYIGGNGPDTFTGGNGGDAFDPGGGTNNPLTGNAGEDIFYLTGGINTIAGGNGADRLIFDLRGNGFGLSNQPGVPITVDPAGGMQGAYTNNQNASVNFTGIENITIITDNNSSDNITTGTGEDEYSQVALDSSTYIRDTANLGAGIDRISVDARATNGSLSFLALNYDGSGEVGLYGNGKLGFTGTERFFLQGGNAADDLRGLDFDDRFDGNAGNDRLAGRGGNDDLRGGAGADVIDGDGRVTMLLAADNQNNAGTGTSDNDFRVFGQYTAANPFEADLAVGTGNVGTVRMRIRASDVDAGETDEVYVNDVLVGTLAQFPSNPTGDTIFTFDAALLASGTARVRIQNVTTEDATGLRIDDVELTLEKTGNDRLDGGTGVDQLVGGRGDDVYVVDEDRDQAQEQAGQGTDTVLSQGRMFTLGAGIENLTAALPATATALTAEVLVNTSVTGSGQFPYNATPLADGGYVITWFDQNNGGDARGRVFNADGSARSGEFLVTEGTAGNQGQFGLQSVQLDNGNILVATYATGGTGGEQIIGRLFDVNGIVQGGEFVLGDTAQYDAFPTMQRLDNGQVAMVWQNNNADGSGFGLTYRVLNADGSVGAAAVTFNTTTLGDQFEPVMAKLDDGRMIVAWESRESGGDVIRARVINADGTLGGNDFTVSATGGDLYRTTITSVSGGGFAVSWETAGTVQGRVFGTDLLPLGAPFQVNATAQTTEISSLTRLPEGGFMATWASFGGIDGSGLAILGRLFNADGSARGGDFIVNQVTDSFQNSPRVITLADGRVLVTFGSEAFQAGNYDVKQIILDTTPNQTLVGNELANTVTGGFGSDIIAGSGGGDRLTGNQGADRIYGGGYTGSGTNLIVNGGFETQDGTNVTRDFILAQADGVGEGIAFRGVTSLFGWTRGNTSALIELETNSSSTLFATGDGTSVVNLEYGGNQQQSLSQDVAGLVAGGKYLLRFAANQLASATDFTESMQVLWNGVVVTTIAADTKTPGFYTVILEAAATGTGVGGANRIEFREISSGDAGGTTLDAISLEAIVAAPEMAVGAFGPNLITNGSFEQRDGTTTASDYTIANGLTNFNGGEPLYAFSTQLLGWGFLPGTSRVEFNMDNPTNPGNLFQTADGLVGLDMDVAGNEPVGIFQDVTGLAAGERYRITVSAGLPVGPNNNADQSAALQVIWNGRIVGTITPTSLTPTDYSFDVFAQATGPGVGGANRLALQEVGGEGGQGRGTALDNIRLNLVTAADVGADTVDYSAETGGGNVSVNLATGTATDTYGTTDQLFSIENATTGAGNDTLTGNAGVNRLSGGGGNDMLDGGAAFDTLIGGAGNDTYIVDDAADVVTEASGEGTDEVRASAASYTLSANIETLTGTSAAGQTLTGNSGANVITGLGGNDTLDGAAGVDTLIGGAGNDSYIVDDAADVVTEAASQGTDEIRTGLATYSLAALANVENLTGTSGAGQTLTGNGGANVITGAGGNDTLDGGAGSDTLVGGAGNDVYIVDDAGDVVTELADGGNDEIRTTVANYQLAANVETLTYVGVGAATLSGNSGNNSITGGGSNDVFNLSQGGNDTVNGGGGNDAFFFGAAFNQSDRVDGGAGANDQLGLQGDYTGGNALTLSGANLTGVETVALLAGFDYNVTALDDLLTTGQRMTIFGSGLGVGDNLTFDGSAETSGSFLVYGGLGTDLLTGGGGADGFQFAAGRFNTATDVVNGGGGNDQVALNAFSGTLSGANLISIETVVLSSGSNAIVIADDWTLAGQSRTVFGSALTQGATIDGSAESNGNLALYGGSGNDTLTGGAGRDMIIGGAGADIIRGGLGGDMLRGDGGADTFILGSVAESTSTSYDTLTGFDASIDKIDLPTAITAIDAAITVCTLSSGSFDSDLSAALSGLGANHAITFTADQGDLAGRIFLVADTNGIAGYQAGQDAVFELVNPVQPILDPTPFI